MKKALFIYNPNAGKGLLKPKLSDIIDIIVKAGYEVVVYDNLCNSSKESLKSVEELTGKTITFYEGDVMDEAALKAMLEKEGVDAVIHCAALKAVGESVQKPLEYYRNNITGTLTLMDVMKQTGV